MVIGRSEENMGRRLKVRERGTGGWKEGNREMHAGSTGTSGIGLLGGVVLCERKEKKRSRIINENREKKGRKKREKRVGKTGLGRAGR